MPVLTREGAFAPETADRLPVDLTVQPRRGAGNREKGDFVMVSVRRFLIMAALALAIAGAAALLSGLPPFSLLYRWLSRRGLNWIWYGLTAGVIGICLVLYRMRSKK